MLSFNQFFMLLESRLDKVKEIFKDVSTEHDALAKHRDSDSVVDHFATTADPTHNKSYTQWIMNQYKRKNIRQEDAPRIHTALTNFDRYKSKLQNKDLNSYKHISDLEDAVEPHLGKAASNKEEKREIKSEGAELLHSGNGVTIHHLKTKEAACHYGSGTKWCTAASKNNAFDFYNESGPILIIQHAGRKYQMHGDSGQFMDEKDKEVDFKNIHSAISDEMIKANNKSDIIAAANFRFDNPRLSSEHVTTALSKGDENMRIAAVNSSKLTAKHMSSIVKDPSSSVKIAAIKKHNDFASSFLNDPAEEVRAAAVTHGNLSSAQLHAALSDPAESIRKSAVDNPRANDEHFERAIQDKSFIVRAGAARNVTNPQHISKIINNESDSNVFDALLYYNNNNLNKDHRTMLLRHKDQSIRGYVVKALKLNPQQLNIAARDESPQKAYGYG